MLGRVGPRPISAREANTCEAPLAGGLEFNPPAHGTWNIVHIGMLVPESHQVYVCGTNCMRGVVLTAQEMGASERFSCVVLEERDLVRGTVLEVTLEGVSDVLAKLERRGRLPRCLMVFPVCTHLFLGIDMRRVYAELVRRWPGVDFVRSYMDPISRKRLTPDARLRRQMHMPIRPLPPRRGMVAHIGSDFPLDADADVRLMLSGAGRSLASVHDMRTYDEFLGLGAAEAIMCTYPNAHLGATALATRLGRPLLYCPLTFDMDEIERQERELASALDLSLPDFADERRRTDEALEHARHTLGEASVAIDALAHPRPLSVARLLAEHGFHLDEVFVDAIAPEERADLTWLSENVPDLRLWPMTRADMRVQPRRRDHAVVAIGQRAAWFCGTDHFVNIVEGAGLFGYSGIRHLCALLAEAARERKDAQDLIPRKGLGCVSVI